MCTSTSRDARTGRGFKTATRAAAAGGVTTLVDMPLNCVPETIDERL
jgi:dihydroorotase-like cyclic amidohydrolase